MTSLRIFLAFAFALLAQFGLGQSAWVPGEVLVRLSAEARIADVQNALAAELPLRASLKDVKSLGAGSRYHKITVHGGGIDDRELEKFVARVPGVEAVSLNFKLTFLAEPNDAQYGTQWNLEDINVEPVWNNTTGGTMANGMRIGVGICDQAMQTSHDDLEDNIWPGSPTFGSGADHGTEVASVVGAVGNNSIGISGVNWDVEILSGTDQDDLSDALEQFELALLLRQQFNSSSGQNGLMIATITVSWIVPGVTACDGFSDPLFSEMADAGILLVTGGDNVSFDMDSAPMYPASCALAEHLVVTSYGPFNEVPFAIGNSSVHLLAPGVNIPLATVGDNYTVGNGNSYAIPHLAGAIALLYSIPCPSFAALVMNDPQAARTLVKNAILNNTTPFPGGSALTITGGKLNVHAAYQALMTQCVPTCSNITVTFTSTGNAPAACTLTDWTGAIVATSTSAIITACIEDGCLTAMFTDVNGDPIAGTYEVTGDQSNIIAADASSDGIVQFGHGTIISGCTTPGSGNYNPSANCDDGTCGSVTCIPIQFQVAAADFVSEGSADVLVVSNDSVLFDAPLEITFNSEFGSSFGVLDLCVEPGCLSYTIISTTVTLYEVGALIVNGDENGAVFFATSEPFNTFVGPGGTEICDGLDNDCDGLIDEDFTWYTDNDGDDFGAEGTGQVFCSPPTGMSQQAGDCDDTNPTIFPGAEDACSLNDGIDNDCDGNVDEDGVSTWYYDQDLDGFGVAETLLVACAQPVGYAPVDGDCDNNNAQIFPDAPETCDGLDNDCDGGTDEDFFWYTDADGDGFGDNATQQVSCTPLPGGVQTGGDCNDANSGITHIGAACNDGDPGTINDVVRPNCTCLGFLPGDCPPGEIADCNGNCAPIEWIGDGSCDDGSFDWNGIPIFFNCPDFADDGGDCSNPCFAEICDGLDNDCDGDVDEDFTWYTDADGDEYGAVGSAVILCSGEPSPGMVQQGGDCDDASPVVNPAQNELCGDSIDNNCDGVIDGVTADFQSGCTNPLACNYDPNAFCDDGSCLLDTQPLGNEVYSPDWTLEDTEGNSVELFAMLDQGHTVILDLFTTWCPPSQAILSSGYLDEWYQHLGPSGLEHIRMVSIEMEDTATTSLAPFDQLSSWPVIARGGPAIAALYASIGIPINAFPTILMICPDRSVTKIYGLGVDELPGNSFQYDQEDGLQLLNELCGCHSAPCTGTSGCPDPAACNYNPAATCSDGTCAPGTIWYADSDGDGFGFTYNSVIACVQPSGYVAANGDCNDQQPSIHPGALELCDGLDNDCDGQGDEGLAPVIACTPDINVNSEVADCSVFVSFDPPNLSCGQGFITQTMGPESGSNFPQGNTTITYAAFSALPSNVLFTDSFASNAAGWTLDTEWQIGTATASVTCECNSSPSEDPAEDHSATVDNGVAGMNIGGCVDGAIHGFRYLTSPVVDVSAVQGPLVLEFWRHLHADYAPYMEHVIEVFDGTQWIQVWSHDIEDCINDVDWALQHVDATGAKNAAFQVRFGQAVGEEDAFITGGWSIDDVRFLGDLVPSSTCSFDVIVGPTTWYADADGDGYGDVETTLVQCEQPSGYVDNANDCNDSDPSFSPAASEVCDGLDNDCDGQVDDGIDVDNDLDGFTLCGGDCNDNDSEVHPGVAEVCDGIDNDCNGLVDDGFPVSFTCPADTTIQTAPYACSGAVTYTPPAFTDCAGGSFTLINGLASGAAFPVGTTTVTYGGVPTGTSGPVLLSEDFSDNSAAWTLDPEWQIGPAQQSFCSSSCGADPASDNTTTADNGVAGMIIGGCASTALHAFRYLTSPAMDAEDATALTLEFWRNAHGDYAPYMQHHVQVFNGVAWVTIWEHTAQSCINDVAWTFQTFDVTAHKNVNFQIRFGQSVGQAGAFNSGGWSVDDVRVVTEGSFDILCSFDITVLPTDTTATFPCGASVTLPVDDGSCTASSIDLPLPLIFTDCALDTLFNDAPEDLPLGMSLVHWIAVHGDLSTDTCTLEVLVVDEEAPVITCSAPMTITADPGTCFATNVVLSAPTTADNCSVASVTSDPPSTTFIAGTTEVTWTVLDGSGNSSTCVQLVTVEGDSGLPPTLTCPSDTTLTMDPLLCGALFEYSTPVFVDNCISSALQLTSGLASGSLFPAGTTVVEHALDGNYLNEDFSDNAAGWTLGTEWQIGYATQSGCANSCPGNDPDADHSLTADNGVAGMAIGGCVSTALHPFAFIEGPAIDATSATSLTLEFWRHLHTDYAPFMQHRVDVFNGNAWVTVWEHLPQVCLNDADWTLQSFDVTAHKNSNFRVRFGQSIGSSGAFSSGGWSVDDVRVFDPSVTGSTTCSFAVTLIGSMATWYADNDGDGFGDPNNSLEACIQPGGYVQDATDCLDDVPGANIGSACDDGDPTTINDLITELCVCAGTQAGVSVLVRLNLEGAYDPSTGLMRSDLHTQGLLPMGEPYTALGYAFVGGGGETTTGDVLDGSSMGPAFVKVDWVVVELRDPIDPTVSVASRAGLLQRDGIVTNDDGTVLFFSAVPPGNYHIAVRHRNHLGAMTALAFPLDFAAGLMKDFTDGSVAMYGTNSLKTVSGTFPALVLWCGDATFDGVLKYTGVSNDRDPILVEIGGSVPTNTISGYYNTDVNLDGTVKYTGTGNDRDPILINVGGSVPTNVRLQQLP